MGTTSSKNSTATQSQDKAGAGFSTPVRPMPENRGAMLLDDPRSPGQLNRTPIVVEGAPACGTGLVDPRSPGAGEVSRTPLRTGLQQASKENRPAPPLAKTSGDRSNGPMLVDNNNRY
eukprot:scpid73998/ scgid35680/ 